MAITPGKGPGAGLRPLLSSLIDFSDHATQHQQQSEQMKEDEMSQSSKGSMMSGAAITTLVSLIALIFSGYSFYETVLKQPALKLYAPPLIHLYRKNFKDILAIPVTLSNDGAKRGTVLAFDLQVTNPATGEQKNFRNIYFGNDPKNTSRIFTPLTIAGRSSLSEIVLFEAEKTGAFFKTTGGVDLELSLKLTPIVDQAEYWQSGNAQNSLQFNVETGYIASFNDMERGTPTVLRKKTR